VAGTTTDYETYDGWNEDAREIAVVRPVHTMTPGAQQLHVLLVDLREMAGLVERTIDLVRAPAIVVGMRSSLATAPWRR
jgi:hypothetical protein